MPVQTITAGDLPEIRADLVAWLVDSSDSGGPAVWSDLPDPEWAFKESHAAREWSGVLREATLFFVGSSTAELAVASGLTLPTYQLHPEDVPAPRGLLVWEMPVTAPSYGGEHTGAPITAASWAVRERGVEIRFWAKREDWLEGMAAAGSGMAALNDAQVRRLRTRFPMPLVFQVTSHLPFRKVPGWLRPELLDNGSPAGRQEKLRLQSDLEQAERALVVTWLLMGQPLTSELSVEPSRAAAKRLHRVAPDLATTVRYTHLRHGAPSREPVKDGAGVVYRHQWVVRGHWRSQWYPARQTHRPIWIADHVKGPEGAPLLDPGKLVHVLRG
ncbi:hypothetical protein ACFYNO_14420 [Kitasatospora sp. NPDC006697]|uniref:hypothetical protein n=1 Tax=unclassified Kitasatospora TaxID=2633591 RepID=UPI00368769ED